jgi:uncharacterized protein (TIGR02271 family)
MSKKHETISLREGMDVIGADGEKLGSVDRLEGDYLVAKKGWFFPSDYFVPTSAITGVEDDRVVLNVTKDEVLDQGWDAVPGDWADSETYRRGDAGVSSGSAFADQSSLIGASPGSTNAGTASLAGDGFTGTPAYATDEVAGTIDTDETIRVPLAEEELTATRRPVQRGEVRIEKDVVEEEQSLDVPVMEEHVNVTRRVVDRDVDAGDHVFEAETIDVPVRGEEVDVQKHAHVTEEIEISKEAVEETQHVTDTVRRERARITDTTGEVDTNDLDGTSTR